jgi:hypothetical protein
LTLERLTYRFVGAGFVLLSATLLAGFLFGDALYGHGHAWRWDHKTVFSTLAWLTFALLDGGRYSLWLAWQASRPRAVHRLGLFVAGVCRVTFCDWKSFWGARHEVLAGVSGGTGDRLALACLARVEATGKKKHRARPHIGVRHGELQAMWAAHSVQ